MENQYRAGPVYRAGLIVSGGMCAGLGIAILVALALHRVSFVQLVPASVPTPPASAVGFVACGLALIGIGVWIPQVTSILAMIALSMGVTLTAERVFGLEPRVETLIAANLGADNWLAIAPNTLVVLLLAAAALVLRHSRRWSETRLATIAALGSANFAIGAVACVGYMTGIPTYVWQAGAPMSCLSSICASVLGLGIVMSACRYSELDESGMPRWFSLAVWTGALAINLTTAVAYFCRDTQTWQRDGVVSLMPMIIVSAVLALVAARPVWRANAAGRNWLSLL
jgi:hypothetical protein